MFELNRDLIEEIIFAMEDQDGEWGINLETGEVFPFTDAEGLDTADDIADPPAWNSREGFKLMEDFVVTLRGPNVRRELQAALSRGRGVFKAFKATLAANPETERLFREYKIRVMGRRIREWYDECREARGLERLGSEPEDVGDLVTSEFGLSVGPAVVARPVLWSLFEQLEMETLERLPASLASWEFEALKEMLADEGWIGAWADDGEGGAIAGGAARRENAGGRGFCRIFALYVRQEFRRAGLGRALIERLGAELGGREGSLVALDVALLPREYGERLAASGYEAYGCRAIRRG